MNHESEEHLLHQVTMMEANIDKNKIEMSLIYLCRRFIIKEVQ